LALLEGEVALIAIQLDKQGLPLVRRTLRCINAPCLLPVLSAPPPGLLLRMKVVRPARLIPDDSPQELGSKAVVDRSSASAPRDPLSSISSSPPRAGLPLADIPDPATLLAELLGPVTPKTQSINNAVNTPFTRLVGWLAERNGTTARPLLQPPDDPQACLLALLERADLIARPLRFDRRDLGRDCGDLIWMGPEGPLLLLSEPDGYRLRDPDQPDRAPRRLRRRDLPPGAVLRGLGVIPALQPADTSTTGLVRFSFGPASHGTSMVLLFTALGLALGFLLAIGREVGAIRWIGGLGALGALLGLGLALLSNSLRPALLTATLSTLLGLLLPTFNTLLTNQALPDRDTTLMLQLGLLLVAAALANVGLQWTQSRTLITVQQKGGNRLELAALNHLLRLPYSFFRQYKAGELALRFGAIATVQREVQSLLSGGALQALLSGIYLLFMLRISVKLTALAVLLAVFLVVPTVWIGRRYQRLERRREEDLAEASSRNLELITSVAKLRLAGVETAAARHWWQPYQQAITSGYRLEAQAAQAGLLQTVIPNLGTLLLFILITRLVAEAAASPSGPQAPNIGELLGFFAAFSTFIGAVASSAALMVRAFELPVLLERARPLLTAAPENEAQRLDPGPLEGAVALEQVRFRYRSEGPWVLDGINLHLKRGEFVAVVGPSGSGKSTLVRLLLGLEQPQQGAVLYDGRALDRLRADLVRRQIGVVTQNGALLAGSVLEVIAGGASITHEQAWEAAEQAGIAEDIQAMPMGLHTLVSEGGGNLSGGQRQRLAIARALARQPKLLILDEATSALDNHNQAVVSRSLEALGITRLIVAHRLSTVRRADRIVVLEAGRLVQTGSFEELMAIDGPFADLMRRQISASPGGAP
jgi:ATP-binding cassette subfamily B protein